jgi:hypothetical protein
MTRTATVFRRKRPPGDDAAEKEILDPCQGKLWSFLPMAHWAGIMREFVLVLRRSRVAGRPGVRVEPGIPAPIRCLWKKARERVVAALICIITLCCALLCSATNDDATATTFPVWVPASASVRFPCVRDAHRVSLCRPAGGVEPSISGTCCQDKSVCRSTWPAGTRPGSTGGDANAGPKSIFLPPGRTADKDGHHAGRPAGAPNPSHNA